MDEALGRFPHIIEAIIDLLSNEEICKLREVSQTWQNFVDTPRMFDWRLSNKGEDYSNYFYHLHPHEDQWGQTNLHFAAMTGQCQVVELKLEEENSKSEIEKENQVDGTGRMPLHYAAEAGHLQVCELLMENMVDKNPRDFHLSTPFHSAAKNGHVKVCKLFMDNNITDIKNLMDSSGISPIKQALLNEQIEVCKLITDNVEDEDLQNKPIHLFLYICMLLLLLPRRERHLLHKFCSFHVDLAFCAYFLFTLAVPTIVTFFYPSCVGKYFILLYVSSIPFYIGLSRILHYYLS